MTNQEIKELIDISPSLVFNHHERVLHSPTQGFLIVINQVFGLVVVTDSGRGLLIQIDPNKPLEAEPIDQLFFQLEITQIWMKIYGLTGIMEINYKLG